jgi:hypothetical protein
MPKRLTLSQLDRVVKTDPKRGLEIIQQRAQRDLTSPNPLERFKGQVTRNAVDEAKARLRRQPGR